MTSPSIVAVSATSLSVLALVVDPTVFAAAAVLVIGAIGGAAVLIINALSKMKTDILEKQALLDKKVEVVQGHVNGMTTAASAKRTADEDTILSLQRQLADSEKRAVLLAQAKTNIDIALVVPNAPRETPSAPGQNTLLKSIDQNTAETSANTQRTQADVQATHAAVEDLKKEPS